MKDFDDRLQLPKKVSTIAGENLPVTHRTDRTIAHQCINPRTYISSTPQDKLSLPELRMAPRIYTSSVPYPPLAHCSVFTHLFASTTGRADDVGGYPASAPAFIDAATGTVLTRGHLKRLALEFAHGLRTHAATRAHARRGGTVMVYAPNGLAWPVVVFGSGEPRRLPA